jgi:hypothetical protein
MRRWGQLLRCCVICKNKCRHKMNLDLNYRRNSKRSGSLWLIVRIPQVLRIKCITKIKLLRCSHKLIDIELSSNHFLKSSNLWLQRDIVSGIGSIHCSRVHRNRMRQVNTDKYNHIFTSLFNYNSIHKYVAYPWTELWL